MRAQLEPGRFFLPGPTEVHPEVLAAQAGQMIGHRGRDIEELMAGLQPGLAEIFRTERPVIVSTSSATGLMEAAIRNGVGRGKVLSLVNGAFSARFAEIASGCGKEVDVWAVPYGEIHSIDDLTYRLAGSAFEAVTVTHSETSTGALQNLRGIAEAVSAHPDTLLLVDSVTGIGGVETLTDGWGIDFILTGSQKALALPPGLAFGVASEAMMERAVGLGDRGWYFDIVRLVEDLTQNQTPATPAVSLLYALETQLARIKAEGVEGRWKRHQAMLEHTEAWTADNGVSLLTASGERSPTVSCIRVGDPKNLVSRMRDAGWVIGGGYGKLKDETIRIGHMGDHTVDELAELLEALTGVLSS